jgi:hypothetical protein
LNFPKIILEWIQKIHAMKLSPKWHSSRESLTKSDCHGFEYVFETYIRYVEGNSKVMTELRVKARAE